MESSRATASAHAGPPTRIAPASPERVVALPTLFHSASSIWKGKREGGAGARQRVRRKAELQEEEEAAVGRKNTSMLPIRSRQKSAMNSASAVFTAAAAASSPPSVLLRHTHHGTTRVLYADGHVDTFASSDAAAAAAASAASSRLAAPAVNAVDGAAVVTAAAARVLPTVSHVPSSSRMKGKLRKGRKAGARTANKDHNCKNDALRSESENPSLPRIVGTSSGDAEAPTAIVLPSYEAAAQINHPAVLPASQRHGPSLFNVGARCVTSARTTASNNASTSLLLQEWWALPRERVDAAGRHAGAEVSSNGTGATSTAPAFSSRATSRASSFLNQGTRKETGGQLDESTPPSAPGRTLLSCDHTTATVTGVEQKGGQSKEKEVAEEADEDNGPQDRDRAAFFLTSVPAGVPALPMEDTIAFDTSHPGRRQGHHSSPSASAELACILRQLQLDLRKEFAAEQRSLAEAFVHRFQRSLHDSPSLFSLSFPFRPLEEIYRDGAQHSAAAAYTPADGPRRPSRGSLPQHLSTPPSTAAAAATAGVADVLSPAAQITTPMGWTLPELIEERLLPREAPALQHRYRELLALRGVVDAPDTTACRFFIAFFWFVVLRCRKAHREQTLVDGHRRLSKAFTDAFPLSSRDTLPTLDVLGQLLIELYTCERYERTSAKEAGVQQLPHQLLVSAPPSSAAASCVASDAGATSAHNAHNSSCNNSTNVHREGPHYANLAELASHSEFFPLLTGEWAYLLRHAQATSAAAVGPTTFSSVLNKQSSTVDVSSQEQVQQKLSILPSSSALDTLYHVYHELWLLHSNYVEICLYEEELYKQLAVLFRNLCMVVNHAAAGPATAKATAVNSTHATLTPRKAANASSVLTSAKSDNASGVNPRASRISVNSAQIMSVSALAASPEAKDSVLDSLLVAVAHATHYNCVFCFPNDVYAGLFDDEFRTDVVQWLSYCCHGVVTTHVQTKHWPVPVQADFEAAQQLRSAAERRELAAFGLQQQRLASSGDATSDASGSASQPLSASRRRERGDGTWAESTAPSPHYHRISNGTAALQMTEEGPLDVENDVANAEFRLAHEFDCYSRAAAQHVSELERRMARLQRRHQLASPPNSNNKNNNSSGYGGGGLRRRRSSLASLAHAKTYSTLSQVMEEEEESTMRRNVRPVGSTTSRNNSLRSLKQAPQRQLPSTLSVGAALNEQARSTSTKRDKSSTGSVQAKEKGNAAPSFPTLDVSDAVALPATPSDSDVSAAPSCAAASAAAPQARTKPMQRPTSILHGSGVAKQKQPKQQQQPQERAPGQRRRSSFFISNAVPRNDPRDMFRTSAFVETGRNLVALAAELNEDAVCNTASTDVLSKMQMNDGRESKAGQQQQPQSKPHFSSSGILFDSGRSNNANSDIGESEDRSKTAYDPSHVSNAVPPSAVSLLSSYPLCTCPAPITEYWIATLLRVSSWWASPTTAPLCSASFSLYVSPAAAALSESNDSAEVKEEDRSGAGVVDGSATASEGRSEQQPLCIIAHEPWRGLYGRIIAIPPISCAAQRAALLINFLAESLPHQQSRVYLEVQAQRVRQEQQPCCGPTDALDAATTPGVSPPPPPNLGTAVIPFISPFTSGLESLSAASLSSAAPSVASYLRRRGIGETYQGCTSPFFQLYRSIYLILTLSSEEVSLLRESLDIARGQRREAALLGCGLCTDHHKKESHLCHTTNTITPSGTGGAASPKSALLTQSSCLPGPSQDIHEQQMLWSLLPQGPPTPNLAAAAVMSGLGGSGNEAALALALGATDAHTRGSTRGMRKVLRAEPAAASAGSAFVITAIPREEAKLRPCRLRPLQTEALRRRTVLLADMETIEKRDNVARQNYVVQQLRLANAMAELQTDTMLRRYRALSRQALERLETEEADSIYVCEADTKCEDQVP